MAKKDKPDTVQAQPPVVRSQGPRLRAVGVRRVLPGLRGYQVWRVDVGEAGTEERPSGPYETILDASRRASAQLDKLVMPVPTRLKHG